MNDTNNSSPLSSSSDNSDVVNTSSAKVYFGPVQSPEKKFAPMLSPCKPSTQSIGDFGSSSPRRSPRLSSPQPTRPNGYDQDETEQEEEGEGNDELSAQILWEDTHCQQILRQDEPSSAIASRIMRALDNPSPPPKALRPPSTTARSMSKLANELVFPPIDSAEESSDAAVEALLPRANGDSTSPSPPRVVHLDLPFTTSPSPSRDQSGSPTPRRSSRRMLSATPQREEEQDLISFDRSINVEKDAVDPIIHSPSPQFATNPMQTIDDLLLHSPPCVVVQDDSHLPDMSEKNTTESATTIFNDSIPTADNLLGLGPSTPPRRRSPRLSALSCSPSPEPPDLTDKISRRGSPRLSDASGRSPRSRKRLRNGIEKLSDGNFLSPMKADWATDSDVTDNESDRQSSPKRKKRAKASFDSRTDERNLQFTDSLSPESARILMALAASEAKSKDPYVPEIDTDRHSPPNDGKCPPPSVAEGDLKEPLEISRRPPSSAQRPPPGTFNLLNPASPIKLTLTPALDNPNRTPARRVRIDPDNNAQSVAVASGIIYTPVFSRPPVGDPQRTPARRIPISESQSTVDKQFKSPGLSFLSPFKTSTTGQKSETSSDSVTTNDRPLIFVKPSPHLRRPDVNGTDSQQEGLSLPPSSSISSGKSSIPSTLSAVRKVPVLPRTGSRIPRIGATPKPGTSSRSSKLPMPSRNLHVPNALPSRLPSPVKPLAKRHVPVNSSGSDDSSSGPSSQPNRSVGPARSINATKPRHNQPAKRTSPPRPMRARLVVPGMFGGPGKKPAVSQLGKQDEDPTPLMSPVKTTVSMAQGPLKAREVVKGTLTKFELREPSSKLIGSYTESREKEKALAAAAAPFQPPPATQGPSIEAFTFSCPVPERDPNVMEVDGQTVEPGALTPPAIPLGPNDDEMVVDDIEPSETKPVSKSSGSRRSSRTRKPVQADVFGSVAPLTSSTPSGAPRRKPGKGPPQSSAPGNIVFFINGASLKNLTNNNTTRNQHYHAELETLIVRKAGNRPESPTMKLRTIAEKQKEEQAKMRAERARRRQMGDWNSADGDSSMEIDGESNCSEQVKHRRGPGEDEDYVTPMRPDYAGKRVKWDRGLEKTVFLDEIELQPERWKAAEKIAPRKSCLVVDPDRVPIDDLGNPVNVDAPLKLAHEKVVVTKYVYDNDIVVQDIEPPRSTRSKSKKKS